MKKRPVVFKYLLAGLVFASAFITFKLLVYPLTWSNNYKTKVLTDTNAVAGKAFTGSQDQLIILDSTLNRYFLVDTKGKKIYLLNLSSLWCVGFAIRTKFPLQGANIETAKFDFAEKPVFRKGSFSFNTNPKRRLTVYG